MTRKLLLLIIACVMLAACVCPPNVRFGTGGGTRPFNAAAAEQTAISYAHKYGFGTSRATMARIVAIGIAESSLNSAARHWHKQSRVDSGRVLQQGPRAPSAQVVAVLPALRRRPRLVADQLQHVGTTQA